MSVISLTSLCVSAISLTSVRAWMHRSQLQDYDLPTPEASVGGTWQILNEFDEDIVQAQVIKAITVINAFSCISGIILVYSPVTLTEIRN